MAVQLRRAAGALDPAGPRGVGASDIAGPRGVGALDIAHAADIGHSKRLLPVADELASLLTQPGLVPGTVLAAHGPGALTLATALAAEVSRTGGWVTAVGLGRMGVSAVTERGASLDRWAFVDEPGSAAAEVLNALIGNVDVILLAGGVRLAAAHSRRLRTRLRERGTVVIEVGASNPAGARGVGASNTAGARGVGASNPAGAFSPDVTMTVERAAWTGLGHGHGRLRERRAEVVAAGRGAASLPRRAVLWLPDANGHITAVRGAIDTVSWPAQVVSAQNGISIADASGSGNDAVVPLQRRAG
ncbi:MAG: hypothetical protein F4Z53_01245 [Acidimicrobiales bacterium]|nr:hypothetical protein [Acidimicrobiales bacterium]MXX41661.1 hypothetical protein [Acidimicrobiales bacterium]MYB81841.1 hypothetical protein [Acidimicrobiales bacterium]MYD34638.1 hypothetical protein [Acidimicrobiales bacterium]MYI09221.1 hypothetical protein [Acidimicrobiales bacterium]